MITAGNAATHQWTTVPNSDCPDSPVVGVNIGIVSSNYHQRKSEPPFHLIGIKLKEECDLKEIKERLLAISRQEKIGHSINFDLHSLCSGENCIIFHTGQRELLIRVLQALGQARLISGAAVRGAMDVINPEPTIPPEIRGRRGR